MSEQARQLRAIVFSDVVDSSVKIFADELIAIQRIKEDLSLIRDAVQSHGGLLVKSLGDGLLVTFDGPSQALQFIQSAVQQLSARGRQSLAHRFGLHTGEIYADGDDILGQGVHLASRLQTVSPVNGVAFTSSTYELIDPRFRELAKSMGDVELKGLPQRMDLYCLGQDELLRFGRSPQDEVVSVDALLQDTPYSVLRPLSRSTERHTLLLQERQRDRQAVLKLIPADGDLEEALRVESACLDRLRHPRIPRVLDAYAKGGMFCFIQEYIAGPSLHGSLDLLRRKQRLAELLRQVLQVLVEVHAAGLVHGDIHPANLILPDSDAAPFLVDFSLLRARTESVVHAPDGAAPSLSEMGRPYFTAPERARFGRITPSADLYALGVSALLLYTGGEPASLYDETLARWTLDALDPEVQRWLAPLLEDQPARRLKQASDALQLLDQPVSVVAPEIAPQSPLPPRLPVDGPWHPVSKAGLHAHLVEIYGPMVELLLETTPSNIASDQLPSVRERLVSAGMSVVDVDEAIRKAQLPPNNSGASSGQVGVLREVVAPPLGSAGLAPRQCTTTATQLDELLGLLRERIGPIADLLWTAELTALITQDPLRFRDQLEASSVPLTVIEELLAKVIDREAKEVQPPPAQAESPPQPSFHESICAEPTSAPTSTMDVGLSDDQLKSILTELIGPIGLTVMEQVADRSSAEKPRALMEVLRGVGLDEPVMEQLTKRFGLI